MKEIRKIIDAYDKIRHSDVQLALASVVNVEESSYRRIGARMLVQSNGQWVGGISGGCLEGDALEKSQRAIFSNKPTKVIYDTRDDDQNQIGVGLGCNGVIEVLLVPIDRTDPDNEIELLRKLVQLKKPSLLLKVIDSESFFGTVKIHDKNSNFCHVKEKQLNALVQESVQSKKPKIHQCINEAGEQIKLLIEYIKPETRLVIVGDNYDVQALVEIVSQLGWEVYLIGSKKKISKQVFKLCDKILDYAEIKKVPLHEYTAVVLMTHDYKKDLNALKYFVDQKIAYLGMLGPRKRRERMEEESFEISLDDMVHFHSPIGLEIGAETPEEIALSVCAEIVAFFRNKEGKSLKYKIGAIHDRDQ